MLWGSGSFSQMKAFFLHKKQYFSLKNAPSQILIFLMHKLCPVESLFFFWPAKNEGLGPFSALTLNTCLHKAEPTGSEDCSLGVKEKIGIPQICSAAMAGALLGCQLLTIFPGGCVGKRRGEAEGARHAGARAVQAAAEV